MKKKYASVFRTTETKISLALGAFILVMLPIAIFMSKSETKTTSDAAEFSSCTASGSTCGGQYNLPCCSGLTCDPQIHVCKPVVACAITDKGCTDTTHVWSCVNGNRTTTQTCQNGDICRNGFCVANVPPACSPAGGLYCAGSNLSQCNDAQTGGFIVKMCGMVGCNSTRKACNNCVPNSTSCSSLTTLTKCKPDGSGLTSSRCPRRCYQTSTSAFCR